MFSFFSIFKCFKKVFIVKVFFFFFSSFFLLKKKGDEELGWMDDGTDDGTDGCKGRRPPDKTKDII